jgi:hypothetical protein
VRYASYAPDLLYVKKLQKKLGWLFCDISFNISNTGATFNFDPVEN